MDTLESLRQSVDATRDLQSIVRTMKALAAVSIRQYERALVSLSDYDRAVAMGLRVVLDNARNRIPRRRQRPSQRLGAIVFGSDQGLCGRFNDGVAEFALRAMDKVSVAPDQRRVLAIGSRARSSLEQRSQNVHEQLPVPGSAASITVCVRNILLLVEKWRTQESISDVMLFYNAHRPDSARKPSLLHLLPVNTGRLRDSQREHWPSRSLPTYSMPQPALLSALLRQYLFVSLFRACAESLASEHASRLESMQLADKNIDDRLGELEAAYRARRQEAITVELLDVVAGYEVLTSAS
jgi:F-type H+-transporting ATPase subunit gamma